MENLFIYLKEGDEFQFPLSKKNISVGKLSDNDIRLKDAFCSGHHAFLYAVEKGYIIRDNKSKNGTFLNGARILGEATLRKGDEILIGTTRIIFGKKISSRYQ